MITAQGKPLVYDARGKAGDVEYDRRCLFNEGKVTHTGSTRGKKVEQTTPLKDFTYLMDNNNFSFLAFLLGGLPREEGKVWRIKIYHPSSMQLLDGRITMEGMEKIESGGETLEGRRCSFVIAGTVLTFWLDGDGRILREEEQAGRLVVEPVR